MGMEYIYAAMLLHKAGKEINEENVAQILKAAGVEADQARVKALVAALSEVDIEEAKKEEEKKKEEEEKEKEEAALEGLGALFG